MKIVEHHIRDWTPWNFTTGYHQYRLDLNHTPASAPLGWSAIVVRGAADGPTFLVTAGVHGDEYEGMEGIRRFIKELEPAELSGTVIAIPVVHEAAFAGKQRTSPLDGLDLARTFPGRVDGSPTERIAHALRFDLLPQCDFYCDLHSAAMHYEILQLSGYQLGPPEFNNKQHGACVAFGLPLIWATSYLPGRSLSAAREADVPAMYVEYTGGGACPEADVEHCRAALHRVTACLDMTEHDFPREFDGTFVSDDSDESGHLQAQGIAAHSGFFRNDLALGDRVCRGDAVGVILDAFGCVQSSLHAEGDGRIVKLRKTRYVEKGESCFAVIRMPD